MSEGKDICRDIIHCVQWPYDERGERDGTCQMFNNINNCPSFDEKLKEYYKHCEPWRRERIERYFINHV
jgi:hypothetical protein